MTIRVERRTGDGLRALIGDLARLRIAVFREWPYLYDGDLAYEERYLDTYARADRAFVAVAFAGDRAVGAATAIPLDDADPVFAEPFRACGFDTRGIAYFGESVLEPAWRGRGIGHRFFDEREAWATATGLPVTTFCAVERAENDPRRPPATDRWTRSGRPAATCGATTSPVNCAGGISTRPGSGPIAWSFVCARRRRARTGGFVPVECGDRDRPVPEPCPSGVRP